MSLPVKFEHPPVVEVVCGVTFQPLQNLRAAHVGLFWEHLRGTFPLIDEKSPLNPVIEGKAGTATNVGFEISELPPMRRTWLLNEDGSNLIQVQQDRFLFNWKQPETPQNYPSYENVIASFDHYLSEFASFVDRQDCGTLNFSQFELTYINIIGPENGLNDVAEYSTLTDHYRCETHPRFLPKPEAFHWNTSYSLPNDCGRLHILARSALRVSDKKRVVRLEVVARGIPKSADEPSRRPWFDLAHEWITRGFADSTNPSLHEQGIWNRTS